MKIYKNLLSAFVLCWSETWSLRLRQEHRLKMYENREVRRIFGHKREEVAGGWRRLHNEEFHNFCALTSIIRVIKSRKMRWTRDVAHMGEMRNAYEALFRKPERKNPLVKTRRKWKQFIRTDLRKNTVERVN
jgi:hypothetical protein